MIGKKLLAAAALGAFVALAALPVAGIGSLAFAAEQPADLQAQGMAALKTFWTAIVAGTPAAIAPVLAPEYQIQRADGSGYDKESYLKSELPKVAAIPEFTSVKITG